MKFPSFLEDVFIYQGAEATYYRKRDKEISRNVLLAGIGALGLAGSSEDDMVEAGDGWSSLQDWSYRGAPRCHGSIRPEGVCPKANDRTPADVRLDFPARPRVPARRRRDEHHAKYQWLKTGGWEQLTLREWQWEGSLPPARPPEPDGA